MIKPTDNVAARLHPTRHASAVALAATVALAAASMAVGCGGDGSKSPDSTAGEAGIAGQGGVIAAGGSDSAGGTEQTGGAGGATQAGTSAEGGSAGTTGQAGEAGSNADAGSGGSNGEAGSTGEAGNGGEAGALCTGDPLTEACAVTDEYAIFVAPGGSGDGTKDSPFGDLQTALNAAAEDPRGRAVLVCNGIGATSIPYVIDSSLTIDALPQPLRVFGGFDCNNWLFDDTRRARFETSATTALRITDVTAELSLRNLELIAGDATDPGDSSIAVMVDSSPSVTLENVLIEAGTGADGEDGALPESPSALAGTPGNDGVAACSESYAGGPAVTTECADFTSGGGKGGDGESIFATGDGQDGAPLPSNLSDPLPATYPGQGGAGESSTRCAPGQPGAAGDLGAPGHGGILGTLTSSGFVPSNGTDGQPGISGQGGGGGGGAKAPTSCSAVDPPTGASGGSGGAGGCGGLGGKGGKGGGASIAIGSIDSAVTLIRCQLTAKAGGKGGDGAIPQTGGAGARGGNGQTGAAGSQSSCDGGNGGRGGQGGAGAGGAGGPSLSIAFVGDLPSVDSASELSFADTPALGGADGNGLDTTPATGDAGVTAHVLEFLPEAP